MVNRARLSQERSRQRRDQLLDAAIELFAEGGSRGITHRAVASRAGLPPATTTYYFTSISELIHEALTRHIENWLRDLRELTAVPVPRDLSLEGAGRLIKEAFAVRSVDVVGLQISVYLAAARNPDLKAKAAEALDEVQSLATRLLQAANVPGSDQVAHAVMSTVAGSALSRMSGRLSEAEEAKALYLAIRGIIVASLLSEDEINAKLAQLG